MVRSPDNATIALALVVSVYPEENTVFLLTADRVIIRIPGVETADADDLHSIYKIIQ